MLPLCDMHCDTAMAIWHEHKSLAKNDLNIDLEKAALRPHIDEGALHQDKKQRLSTTSAAAHQGRPRRRLRRRFFGRDRL